MTSLHRVALAAAAFAGLGGAVAQAQTTASRAAPQGYEALDAGRSVYQAPAEAREDQTVMGLRVPGSGPADGRVWSGAR